MPPLNSPTSSPLSIEQVTPQPSFLQPSLFPTIAFIDRNVSDIQTLLAELQPGTEVHLLDSGDAVAQITQTLLGRKNLSSIHIMSHGRSGGLQLGETWFDAESLDRYDRQVRSWATSLTEDADILLYGCEVGAGQLGQAFMQRLAHLSGADIAASDDLTGNAALGGDWDLEVRTGAIETLYFAPQNYQHTLLSRIDINPNGSSSPTWLTNINGTLFFIADDGITGRELWKSDGTVAGTVRVADINPNGSSSPYALTNVNGTLFFVANDGTTGYELWKSDGTTAGTVRVTDIRPGTMGANISSLTNVNGTLFLAADDGTTGLELWKSDGTTAGTIRVANINSGSRSSNPFFLGNITNTLFFFADDGIVGEELWKSDGTLAGTVRVANINPRGGSNAMIPSFNAATINGALVFAANDGTTGEQLWKTDGTTAGTVRISNFGSGRAPFSLVNLTNVNNTLFFAADDGISGFEIWKTDGTLTGTVRVTDINPNGSSVQDHLINVNGTLYFRATEGESGFELWKSDGTAAGTVRVADINPTGSSHPTNLINVNGTLFFTADNGTSGLELWKSDGTTAGTVRVADINPSGNSFSTGSYLQGEFNNINSTLFFQANDGFSGVELWASDGTVIPSVTLTTITPTVQEGNASSLTISRGSVTSGSLTVNLTIDPSSTADSTDFILRQGATQLTGTTFNVTIPDGASSITITLDAIAEALSIPEPVELLKVNLANGLGYTIGASNTATIAIVDTTPQWSLIAIADFDSDDKTDLIWRSNTTGELVFWKMDGTTLVNYTTLPYVAGLQWQVQGAADVDGDTKTDLLWRHSTTGESVLWKMDGTTLVNYFSFPSVSNLDWQIQAVADFDGDRKVDLLWRHRTTGENVLWKMDGTTLVNYASFPSVASLNWQVQAAADFDGDGKTDLLWRNTVTGENVLWKMDGSTLVSYASFPSTANLNWQIHEAIDFDLDGQTDLLWRDRSTGELVLWKMDDTTLETIIPIPSIYSDF